MTEESRGDIGGSRIAEDFIRDEYGTVYDSLVQYHDHFVMKPPFVFGVNNGNFYVARKDLLEGIVRKLLFEKVHMLQKGQKVDIGRQLTIADYYFMKYYHGDEEHCGFPITAHDIFLSYDLSTIIKTGNDDINNAPYDFGHSLLVKYLRGIIEMEVPIGFIVNKDKKVYSTVFYKYIPGINLESLLKTDDRALINSMLWEVAKLFSRLIQNDVFFYDSSRFNNYYIETYSQNGDMALSGKSHNILRLLDGEHIFPKDKLLDHEREYMIKSFVNSALSNPHFLDKGRLEDFLMVCLGDYNLMKEYRDTLDNIPTIEIDLNNYTVNGSE